MATTVTRDFTTFANVARSGATLGGNWNNASNAASDDGNNATSG